MNNIYNILQERLDLYSFGFPRSASGTDLAILQKFFTEEDAKIFLLMSLKLETPDEVAARTGMNDFDLKIILEDMASRGLLFRLNKEGVLKYGAIPLMHGLVAFHINNLNSDTAGLIDNYFQSVFNKNIAENAGLFLRVIPVNKSVIVEHHRLLYSQSGIHIRDRDIDRFHIMTEK